MDGNITINIVGPGTPPSPTPIDPVTPNTGLFTSGTSGPEATIITAISAVLILTIVAIIITSLLYRKQKKSGKVTKLVHIIDSTKAVLKSNKRITTTIILLAILTSTGTFIALARNAVNASENDEQSQTEGTNDSSLTVDVSSEELTIEVANEPVFAVLPVDVTVEEATQAGYTLTAFTDSTDLVSTTDESKTIPMVAVDEDELVALTDNTYGLALTEPEGKDSEVYATLSTDADSPTFITDKDYKATEANDTTTVYYGFYITPDTPYGTYKSSDIYYNATTNSSKVIFNGNGLYFNNNPEQTTNDVEYITGITSNTAKYSHTPNINDGGVKESNLQFNTFVNDTVTIPNAASLKVQLTYGGGDYYGYIMGYLSFWEGSHPDYRANINNESGIQKCGDASSVDGRYYSNNSNSGIEMITTECYIAGDTVTFDYWTNSGGPGGTIWYGYYVVVTGYDADGNAIYLPGNIEVGGEYKDPAQDLPYIFKGWSEYKDATSPTYTLAEDIEKNAPLTMGETTELYAIWQHATKIHFDGNGSTSGEIPDKLLKPGEGANLCGYSYSRDGYIFNNWNTKPDGSGESYGQCYWYTAPTDQSVELNLYAQWLPTTTITFNGNGADSGSMAPQTIVAGTPQSLTPNAFAKDGYIFNGWNTVQTPTTENPGTAYADKAQYTASTTQPESITLYAQWKLPPVIGDLTYMQDFATLSEKGKTSVLNSMAAGEQYQLKDNRDQKNYYVSKLADNKIWMTQNLDLDLRTSTELTPANTNISSNWTPANSTISFTGTSVPGWQSSSTAPDSADPGDVYYYTSNTNDDDIKYNSLAECKAAGHTDCAHYHAGNYYNWSAAVASNDTSSLSTQFANAPGSICPAGWRLPTGRDRYNTAASRKWNAVLYAEGVASSSYGDGYKSGGFNKIRTAPLWLVRSGGVYDGSLSSTGNSGTYWSSTVYDNSSADSLYFYSSYMLPAFVYGRSGGYSVRCVAQ